MKRAAFGPRGLALSLGLSSIVACHAKDAFAGDARVHDGFYLRLGAGLGYGIDSISSDPISVGVGGIGVTGKVDGTATGFAGASELAVGWSVADGLALGGGLYSAWIFSPKASGVAFNTNVIGINGQVNYDVDFDASSFHVLGPFVDYYLDAQEGFHLQGGLGYAWLSAGDGHIQLNNPLVPEAVVSSTGGGGFGLMFGAGDEWWVSDGFSLGLLARLTMGFMSGERNNVTWNHTAFAPALLFVATMN
jgi:hypothetical protein